MTEKIIRRANHVDVGFKSDVNPRNQYLTESGKIVIVNIDTRDMDKVNSLYNKPTLGERLVESAKEALDYAKEDNKIKKVIPVTPVTPRLGSGKKPNEKNISTT